MKYLQCVALLAGGILALSGCTGTVQDAPPPSSAPAVSEAPAPPPPPAPVEPVEQEPTDNCGLDPADMDQKTKVQCGLVVEEESTAPESDPIECSGSNEPVQSSLDGSWYCDYAGEGSGEMTFTEQCQAGILTAADGCGSADTPEDDGPGSMYTNPQPGVDYGLTPEKLHQEGCDLGYLTEEC